MSWKFCFIVTITTLLLSTTGAVAAGQVYNSEGKTLFSLEDLYPLALEQSESINIAREDLFIAQKQKSRAFSVLVPRFTAFGSYTISDGDHTRDPAAPPVYPAEVSQQTDSALWGVRFDQSIALNGKEIIAFNISKENIRKSNFDLTAVKEDYLFQVASAYYQVLRALKGKEIATENVKRLETHRNAVSVRLRLEEVTKTDMYRADSELSDAEAKLIEAENTYIYTRAVLRSLVNIPADFKLSEPETSMNTNNLNLEELKAQGLSNRPEIKSAQINQTVSDKNIKLSRSSYWPTLSIEGKYAEQDDSIDSTIDSVDAKYDEDESGYSIGANLTFTLFDGGLRNADVKQALAQNRKAQLALDTVNKNINLEIEGAYLSLITQKSKMESLTDKLKSSQQTYKAVSLQFKHGLSNSVDMMDANTLLVSAERELSDAEFGYKLSQLRLKRTTGTFLTDTGLTQQQ